VKIKIKSRLFTECAPIMQDLKEAWHGCNTKRREDLC